MPVKKTGASRTQIFAFFMVASTPSQWQVIVLGGPSSGQLYPITVVRASRVVTVNGYTIDESPPAGSASLAAARRDERTRKDEPSKGPRRRRGVDDTHGARAARAARGRAGGSAASAGVDGGLGGGAGSGIRSGCRPTVGRAPRRRGCHQRRSRIVNAHEGRAHSANARTLAIGRDRTPPRISGIGWDANPSGKVANVGAASRAVGLAIDVVHALLGVRGSRPQPETGDRYDCRESESAEFHGYISLPMSAGMARGEPSVTRPTIAARLEGQVRLAKNVGSIVDHDVRPECGHVAFDQCGHVALDRIDGSART